MSLLLEKSGQAPILLKPNRGPYKGNVQYVFLKSVNLKKLLFALIL